MNIRLEVHNSSVIISYHSLRQADRLSFTYLFSVDVNVWVGRRKYDRLAAISA